MFRQRTLTGVILVVLSKAFDTVKYELLAAQLHASGFYKNSPKN